MEYVQIGRDSEQSFGWRRGQPDPEDEMRGHMESDDWWDKRSNIKTSCVGRSRGEASATGEVCPNCINSFM